MWGPVLSPEGALGLRWVLLAWLLLGVGEGPRVERSSLRQCQDLSTSFRSQPSALAVVLKEEQLDSLLILPSTLWWWLRVQEAAGRPLYLGPTDLGVPPLFFLIGGGRKGCGGP